MNTALREEGSTGMRVAFAIADKPDAHRIESVRASGQCSNFWFLRSTGSRDLIPMPGATDAQMSAFQPSREVDTATAGSATEIGELAAAVATRLKAEAPAELLRKIDVIIVCTTGIDSQIGVSLASKVKYILGAPQAFPFTLGQMDGCSAFEALRIARAFMHGPEHARVVAIVTTECWWYPYFRSFGDYAQYGDGAAAMLLCAGDAPHEEDRAESDVEIVDVVLGRYQDQQGPFDTRQQPWFRTDAWPQAVGEFLADFLMKHDLSAADLKHIHSPCLDAAFIDAVARASDLPLSPGEGGFVSSVDPMLAFSTLPNDELAMGHALTWSVGLNGEIGACLHRRVDHAHVQTRDPGL